MYLAPNSTRVIAAQTNTLIAGGSSIIVYAIVVQGTATGQVLIEESDGTTAILEMSTVTNATMIMNIPFIAPRGIAITTPANVTCTVFHSNPT